MHDLETIADFELALKTDHIPDTLSVILVALWHDGRGNWEMAHDLVDGAGDSDSAWVHAYLHRKEGDIWNADYWYRRAGKERPTQSLKEEWKNLVEYFLNQPAD